MTSYEITSGIRLELYGTTKKCKKCGNESFNDAFKEGVLYVSQEGEAIIGINGDELIIRKCTNCGYEFAELPLDSKS